MNWATETAEVKTSIPSKAVQIEQRVEHHKIRRILVPHEMEKEKWRWNIENSYTFYNSQANLTVSSSSRLIVYRGTILLLDGISVI